MKTPLALRSSGVLLHPSSLPGAGYCGDLGADARRFVDFIAGAGLRIWQVLPLGPTHSDLSPYQSFSAHAGNPDLVDLYWLVKHGWLSQDEADMGQANPEAKRHALARASAPFFQLLKREPDSTMAQTWRRFLQETDYWLEDYVRFQAFRDAFAHQPWTTWPAPLRQCASAACEELAGELAGKIIEIRFRQFVFHCQWDELRQYAHEHDLLLFGDVPIYVHLESADVWSHQEFFHLDDKGQPVSVTGVPPDYFSAEGQLWGNPQYNWELMRKTGFDWWLQRFASVGRQFDIVRIDHFRALEAYWDIPATATSAMEGKWVASPGRALLQLVRQQHPDLCLVAENLGSISAEVEALRAEFSLPGMAVLQFAFDGNPANPYLTHNHHRNDIVYTGTHDNNTTLGWFESLSDELRCKICDYFSPSQETMPWMLIDQAMASISNTAIVPWQDFLGLDGQHRMNTPGIPEGNWRWRFSWDQVPENLGERVRQLLATHDRLSLN
jgi:4-alpha-glucanotransferase